MNDEQFQKDTEALRRGGYVSFVDDIRARDTAQREALARVEAERDTAIVQMQNIRTNRDRLNKQLGDTEFNLCIAQQRLAEVVGLLSAAVDYCYSSEAYEKGRAFLARHAQMPEMTAEQSKAISDRTRLAYVAQAEQQEAREPSAAEAIDSLTQPLCVISLRGDDRQKSLAEDLAKIIRRYHGHDQEAQGAQPGEFQREDRYIVIKRKDLDRLPMEMRLPFSMALNELAPRLPKRECLVIESDWPEYEPTWAAIRARVEGRAAQPAVRGDEQ